MTRLDQLLGAPGRAATSCRPNASPGDANPPIRDPTSPTWPWGPLSTELTSTQTTHPGYLDTCRQDGHRSRKGRCVHPGRRACGSRGRQELSPDRRGIVGSRLTRRGAEDRESAAHTPPAMSTGGLKAESATQVPASHANVEPHHEVGLLCQRLCLAPSVVFRTCRAERVRHALRHDPVFRGSDTRGPAEAGPRILF
jgi:hypothetical protein